MGINITKDNINNYLAGPLPLVIDFWAPWCSPFRKMVSIIDELSSEYEGKVVIGKCNVDEEKEIVQLYNVRSVPTILFFKDGASVDKLVGSNTKSNLQEKINTLY